MLYQRFFGRLGASFTIILFIISFFTPLLVTKADYVPWNTGWGYTEGDSDHDDSEIHSWRGRSSSIQKKLNNLPDDIVEDLPIPILFGVKPANLTKNFGDPRSGGRTHEGLDIMAPRGTPVVSPTEAIVIHTGTGASSGNYVYTANPGGETFVYMHLNEEADLDEGQSLEEGDLIGYVGNTGNASGGPTHLHFEVREGKATDPYPRLTKEFSLEDKIDFLDAILKDMDDSDDEEDLANVIVSNFRGDMLAAKSDDDIELPDAITDALETVPKVSTTPSSVSASSTLDLTIGSRGSAVVELQKFLISENTGSSAKELASATATGYFGPITERALAEYQKAHNITPSIGYYGPKTRAYIAAQG